jgi:hypothetical protein
MLYCEFECDQNGPCGRFTAQMTAWSTLLNVKRRVASASWPTQPGCIPSFGIVQAALSQDLISLSLGYGAMAGSFVTGASLLFFQRYVYGHSEDSVLLSHRG